MKNYDNEISKFLDWISPWVISDRGAPQLLGWYQDDTGREQGPTLIYLLEIDDVAEIVEIKTEGAVRESLKELSDEKYGIPR